MLDPHFGSTQAAAKLVRFIVVTHPCPMLLNFGDRTRTGVFSMVCPLAVRFIENGNLAKLGIDWICSHAPGFYLNSKQVNILHQPQLFYKLLLQQIETANNRVVLASLYLGNGSLEKKIVDALCKRLREKPDLKVKILLDHTRGSRGKLNSRKMLLPLLKDHKKSCQVSLYQTPFLKGPLLPLLPGKYKEIVGLQHIKAYLFDDNLLISGANLSSDYFTNRQDRYMFISNCKDLGDFTEGLIDRVAELSLDLDEEDRLSPRQPFLFESSDAKQNVFVSTASNSITNFIDEYSTKRVKGFTDELDTVIFPLLEMGPFGIHVDSAVTTKIFENSNEKSFIHLTTGYFNLPDSYIDTIINKSKAQYRILMAHPTANGFYKASWPVGGIPFAYTLLALKFLKKTESQSSRITLSEYIRHGWTYHAKGLWLSSSEMAPPFLTMIGSPNFGVRSLNRDLECQFLLATTNQHLQNELLEERNFLFESSEPFTKTTSADPQRRTPIWGTHATAWEMKCKSRYPSMTESQGWFRSMCAYSVIANQSLRNLSTKVKLSRLRRTNLCAWMLTVFMLSGHASADSELRLGGAINLFSRYGYLSISMRVVPRNDTDSKWLYREPTLDIFKDLSALTLTPVDQNNVKVFEGDFHMEFCDNLRQLLQAYFRDFSFERLDRPWRAFSGSWSRSGMARHLGINSNYIMGRYCYVLVRLARHRESARMRPVGNDIELEEEVARGTNEVIPGDEASVSHFVKNFGSHYVVSYTTGNSLYQVFVYQSEIYARIKEKFKKKGVGDLTSVELSSYFSPSYAEHIGEIQTASGNASIQAWAAQNLRVHFYFFTYPSLLKLHGDTNLLRHLNDLLGNEAVLALDLRTIAPVFKDPIKQKWFLEVMDNYLKLWETNM